MSSLKPKPTEGALPLGLRERNKVEKERRIRIAALDLFTKKGFEATTLREIAKAADVGFGTVFSYANDKVGLLAMIYVEELQRLPPLFEGVDTSAELIQQLTDAFSRHYEFWAKIPNLSLHILKQLEFYHENPHMQILLDRRLRTQNELKEWVEQRQLENQIDPEIDPKMAMQMLYALHTSCMREWSQSCPEDYVKGVETFRHLLTIPMRGLSASHIGRA